MAVHARERLSAVPPERLTPEHRAAVEAFRKTRGVDLFGPFLPLLWSPELMTRTSALGDYLRHNSTFPPHLSEFVILIAARLWSQPYEWSLHCPIALNAGVDRAIVDAIAAGRRPSQMSKEQEVLYDFSTELIERRNVTDSTYSRALAMFGEKGVMDAASLTGYYALLAMILNTAGTPPEAGGPVLPRLPQSSHED